MVTTRKTLVDYITEEVGILEPAQQPQVDAQAHTEPELPLPTLLP